MQIYRIKSCKESRTNNITLNLFFLFLFNRINMNYIKALKIYNDRKGEKNEWCVYKKGTPEYLEVIKIMNDFKEKPIKEKAANTISNAIKIKKAKKELEILKLEKEKKELDKNINLDDVFDIQSINFYDAIIKKKIYTDEIINNNFEQLINFYNEVIKIKKNILKENNYEDFIKLKDQLKNIYIDIDKLEKLNVILTREPEKKEINNIFKDIPKLDDVYKQIDKKDKYKAPYSNKIYKYTDKDKKQLKDIIKKMYEIIDKYDVIKKDLLFIKDDIIKLAELENERIDNKYINYNDFIDEYLLRKLEDTLLKLKINKYDIFTGTFSTDDIIRDIIDSYYISREVIYREFDNVVLNNLINDKFNIEDVKEKINRYINIIIENKAKKQKPIKEKAANTISNAIKIKKAKKELEILKLEKEKKEEAKKPEPEIIEMPINSKKISTDDYIEIQGNLQKNIEKYLPVYLPLFNINDLLGLLQFSRTDIKKLNIFLTPENISEQLIDYSFIINQYYQDKNYEDNIIYDILEPTAGTGNLIAELIKTINPKNLKIDAVERQTALYNIGKARFDNFNNIKWFNEDFLKFKPNKKYDYIFMNPPFNINVGNKQYLDIDFINEAYKLLKDDGRLCAIISSSYVKGKTPKYKKFKDFINNEGVEEYQLNEGFKEDKTISKEMQTNVKMIIVIIDKKEDIESIL
jgi:SAM-dependent methyltransferase